MRLATMAFLLAGLTLAPLSAARAQDDDDAASATPADAAEPDAAQPDAAQPDAAPPDAAQPDAAQPSVGGAETTDDFDEFDDFQEEAERPEDTDEFENFDAEAPVATPAAAAGPPPTAAEVWVLDDERSAADDLWDDYNPAVSYAPRGEVHGGVQLRLAGLIGGSPPALPGPLGELSGFVDVRFGPTNPFHFRIAIAAAIQVPGDDFLGAGTTANTSPGSFRVRVYPLAVDLGHWAAFRLGASLGASLLEDPARSTWGALMFGGTAAEFVVRLLDGMLELGVFAGLQLTAISSTTRVETVTGVTTQGVLGATAAVVF